jgi:hypothetical protein
MATRKVCAIPTAALAPAIWVGGLPVGGQRDGAVFSGLVGSTWGWD